MSACSSTTVVSRQERPTQPDAATESATNVDSENPDDSSTSGAAGTDEGSSDEGGTDRNDNDVEDRDETDRGGRTGDEPLTPRELEEAAGFGLGGADQLAGLLTDCESGSDMACDILFELSAFDSVEEATALNCGGRSDGVSTFCTAGITAVVDELVFDVDSEGLDAIVASCREGDYTACDFLYFRSPFESEFEEIGGSCGDRVQVAVPDCRTFLADDG